MLDWSGVAGVWSPADGYGLRGREEGVTASGGGSAGG
jgi:hypothetical protein